MGDTPVTRKLAAILSADVQGYSRLMGDDEVATIRTLTTYREVMSELIQRHHGRVVDSPGDNLLAEFASAVDAVEGAVAIQKELAARNADLSPDRQMHYRIGINVGDVVVEGERIYGDGVNIAARLESLADGGGICISSNVFEQVENKLDLAYAYQGEQRVKNIAKPVRIYKIDLEADTAVPPGPVGADLGVRPDSTSEDASPLPLPDKPSIAVLPFINMSNDPEQEYFSDGMTDDIITDLSKISGLFVIARNSTFTYKGQSVDMGEVGRRLGVRHVLEGSVRKAGTTVRINVQLVDVATGGHVWAERYDRRLEDIFAVQDEMTQKIVFALKVLLTPEEQARLRRYPTRNLEAYDYVLRGWEAWWRVTPKDNTEARKLAEHALALDPAYTAAYALMGLSYYFEWIMQLSPDAQRLEHQVREHAEKALALDDSLAVAHMLRATVLLAQEHYDQAIAEGERAITLDPNFADGYSLLALTLTRAGQPEEALRVHEQALRLNPHYPVTYIILLAIAYRTAGQYEKALAAYQRALRRAPDVLTIHLGLAATYSELGQEAEARAEAVEVLRLQPTFSLEALLRVAPFKNPADSERFLTSLRKVGLE